MTKSVNTDFWNKLIHIIKVAKNESVKKEALMLLSQYNTAGGMIIKPEIMSFLERHKHGKGLGSNKKNE